ncbi:glycosyltransferase family 2 protein [bacterium]|nr:MAG: glycosyltransferase family 2 protein [bacterium]
MTPLISIIIPVYNSEPYIADTVLSCINQSYKHIEILLINDGSTDRSEEEIFKIKDNRIQYFKIPNAGACEARNFGIANAKGELFQFLDHDDLIENDKLTHQVKCYEKNGDDYIYSGTMGSVSGKIRTIDKGYLLYKKDFTPKNYFETKLSYFAEDITTGAWLVPSKLVNSTHGWDNRAGLNDDGEYFMRIILNSTGIIFCKEAIFYFRRDVPNSLSKQFNSKEVYIKWFFSYQSYAENFIKKLEVSTAKELGWKALSVYYISSYPKHPDLLKQCKAQMKELGYNKPFATGGKPFLTASRYIGVENALVLWNYKRKITKFLKRA